MEYIFSAFANDPNNPLDLLDDERKAIESTLRPMIKTDELVFYVMHNENMVDLIKRINDYKDKITWFHFSGHHDVGLGLQLADGNFRELFKNLGVCKNLKGVFINGCSSRETIMSFEGSVPIYIGTTQQIYDGVAKQMSLDFYSRLNTIDHWNDIDHIHRSYDIAKGNVSNLLEESNIPNTVRGGGKVEDFERDFYLISEKSNNNRILFNNRKGLYYEHKISNSNLNEELESTIETLAVGGQVRKYHEQVPFIFHKFIKALDASGKMAGVYRKNRQYGPDRSELIRSYFFSLLDLCRYSILSILWDEITKVKIQIPQEEILSLLVPNDEYTYKNIKILNRLCKDIILKHGTENEKQFIKLLIPTLEILKEGVNFYGNQYKDNNKTFEIYYRSEQLLQSILKVSSFFNHYHLRSVYSKYYFKHRDSEAKFVVEHLDRKRRKTDSEDILGFKLINVHSVYLCQMQEQREIVINLSPFYFDKNSDFPNAKKIDLYVLDQIGHKYDEIQFEYLPISNPSIKELDEDPRLTVSEDGIEDSTTDFNEGPMAKSIRESKRLYDQLSHFVHLLTEEI